MIFLCHFKIHHGRVKKRTIRPLHTSRSTEHLNMQCLILRNYPPFCVHLHLHYIDYCRRYWHSMHTFWEQLHSNDGKARRDYDYSLLIVIVSIVFDHSLSSQVRHTKEVQISIRRGGGRKGGLKTAKPHRNTPKNRKPHWIFPQIPKPHEHGGPRYESGVSKTSDIFC